MVHRRWAAVCYTRFRFSARLPARLHLPCCVSADGTQAEQGTSLPGPGLALGNPEGHVLKTEESLSIPQPVDMMGTQNKLLCEDIKFLGLLVTAASITFMKTNSWRATW